MIRIRIECPLCGDYVDELFEDEDFGFDELPPGWDRESVLSFARSLTDRTQDDSEGFWTKCFERMEDHMGEEGAKKFCSALKDEYLDDTTWREGPNGDD